MAAGGKQGQGTAEVVEGKTGAGGRICGGKIGGREHTGSEMEEEVIAGGMGEIESGEGGGSDAGKSDLRGGKRAERRAAKELLFVGKETAGAEESDISFADQGRLAGEANDFRSATAGDVREEHAIEEAGGSGGGGEERGVGIDRDKTQRAIIAAHGGQSGEDDGTISAEDERKGTGFDGEFDARAKGLDGIGNRGKIAGARMGVSGSKSADGIITGIDDFEARFAEAIDESRGTKGGRGILAARSGGGSADRSTEQSDSVWLADNLGRHSPAPRHKLCPRKLKQEWAWESISGQVANGRQLSREREADVFADEIEIALVGEAEMSQALADLLDKNFRGGSAGGEADASVGLDPIGLDIVGILDEA